MFKSLKYFLGLFTIILLTACGFQFQNGQLIPEALQTLNFESANPYGDMELAMRKQLQLNGIQLTEQRVDVPVLRLNKATFADTVASVFKQGREAEKILMLEAEASVRMPNKQTYSISAKISRTFFDNSRAALAKSAEKEVIMNDMREQAAHQLIRKMVALQHQIQ